MNISENYLRHLIKLETPDKTKKRDYKMLKKYSARLIKNQDDGHAREKLSKLLSKLEIYW